MLYVGYIAAPKQYNAMYYFHDEVFGDSMRVLGQLLLYGTQFSLTMGSVTFSSTPVSR